MANNKSKFTSEKDKEKERKKEKHIDSKNEDGSEEKDFGGLPSRKLGKNLGCGG